MGNLFKILLAGSILLNAILGFLFFKNTIKSAKFVTSETVTVSRVLDGDTFDTGSGERIRLTGIDAPEYPKACLSQKAKERLEALTSGKTVLVERVGKDHFGRTLGYIFDGSILVNKVMVQEGYASIYERDKQDTYSAELSQSQQEAKELKRGIWSSVCINTARIGCDIKGNYRADRKTFVYHLPTCFNYKRISINEKERDAWFCTEAEARKAGFVRSEDCP